MIRQPQPYNIDDILDIDGVPTLTNEHTARRDLWQDAAMQGDAALERISDAIDNALLDIRIIKMRPKMRRHTDRSLKARAVRAYHKYVPASMRGTFWAVTVLSVVLLGAFVVAVVG